ncbi:hypothetical protein [Nevskia sp.]|uniref:hypothetical protein n=1 Tax=Nevskia sp. TaxID=1929292 RepID=UPI0025DDD586|nr:hypothetical protein [Nevskia sp.]
MFFLESKPLFILSLLVMSSLLSGCGEGSPRLNSTDSLVPDVQFSAPDPLIGQGTARATLLVTNNTGSNINNITADFIYPLGVAIEGGSAGATCSFVSSGNSTIRGYRFTIISLSAGESCGVFMDIYSLLGSGSRTFSVSPGDITGDLVAPNEQAYTWTWNAP